MYNNGNSSKNVTGASVVDGTLENADYADDGISGDKIDGGIISNFQSTGIDDRLPTGKVLTLSTTGVDVTGIVTCDDLNVDGSYSDLKLKTSSGRLDLWLTDVDTTEGSTRIRADAGDLLFITGLNERARITDDGITFNGDTAAANALDDYEEGTFTPTLLGSGSNPTVTYSNQSGKYTKIGRLVTINIYLSTSAYSGGSGNIRIGGLPFAAANENPESTGFIMGFRVNTAAEATPSINAGESFAQILVRAATDTSTGWGNASVGIWTAANPTIAKVCITYET
jgi:hypothetical protein